MDAYGQILLISPLILIQRALEHDHLSDFFRRAAAWGGARFALLLYSVAFSLICMLELVNVTASIFRGGLLVVLFFEELSALSMLSGLDRPEVARARRDFDGSDRC